ncbi:alpha/beta fold hydrolase [Halomonas urumqiensis]|uniref:Sigma factor SigB regulation protein RsbQ n=1 Tax=Halomonas urumqiensis TaxID=1684789 RepID=A0A2N7UN92_9GAMM|nr:alpha/beta hydrolase [Halomonas urumqiensis]PMR81905.1 sigma factor SigB regulation protein RsbQ [Halomonas urumqiensis]PTB03990.1 alpha/beta hydrolase [Halomonas urumqiensis]GHE19749.1 sigma factor SigB regulation protein RsbQ [Halomonas urumqiensis]
MPRDIRHLLNVTEFGHGDTPLLMIHGFGCDQTVWSRLVPLLAADFRLILLDLPGFGASAPEVLSPSRHATLAGHVDEIVELIDALELRDALVIGHSMGGPIAMMASVARPGAFRKLCLMCASARYLDDPPDYIGGYNEEQLHGLMQLMEQNYLDWASTLSQVALGDALTDYHHHDLRERFLAVKPEVLRPLARDIFYGDKRDLLPRVSVPSVVLQPSVDAIVPREAAEYLQRHLPHGELDILDCPGHYPQLTHPELVALVVRQHLRSPSAN